MTAPTPPPAENVHDLDTNQRRSTSPVQSIRPRRTADQAVGFSTRQTLPELPEDPVIEGEPGVLNNHWVRITIVQVQDHSEMGRAKIH